jgi:hypothetical protein
MAPPSSAGPALRCPGEGEPPAWPRLDDHLVEPENSRDEVVRGQRMHVMGALPPHADCQARLTTVLTVHAREGYISSTELQTRSAFDSDFASDFCIRKKGQDPRTGVRYLEELVCEVISEQRAGVILNKAEDLELRGVRRIFGIFLKERQVREWRQGAWHSLPQDGAIEDECLIRPLSVRAILDAAEADDEVARALLSKQNRVLMQRLGDSLDQGHKAGVAEGLRAAVRDLCEVLDIPLSTEQAAALDAMTPSQLTELRQHLKQHRSWPQRAR